MSIYNHVLHVELPPSGNGFIKPGDYIYTILQEAGITNENHTHFLSIIENLTEFANSSGTFTLF